MGVCIIDGAVRPRVPPDLDPPDVVDEEPEVPLDEQEHVGVLPNWEHYDTEEQLHRFATLAHKPDVLTMMYALQPASAATALFDRRSIEQAQDPSLSLETISRRDFPPGRVIIGVDPATASGPRASWFVAIPVLFLPATKTSAERRIIVGMVRQRGVGTVEAQARIVQELAHDWQAEWCAIEAVAGYSYLASYCERTLDLPTKPIVTTERNADDIPALADEVRRGRWVLPGDAYSRRILTPLVEEMLDYPQGSKDCLMALTFARRVHYETPTRRAVNPQVVRCPTG